MSNEHVKISSCRTHVDEELDTQCTKKREMSNEVDTERSRGRRWPPRQRGPGTWPTLGRVSAVPSRRKLCSRLDPGLVRGNEGQDGEWQVFSRSRFHEFCRRVDLLLQDATGKHCASRLHHLNIIRRTCARALALQQLHQVIARLLPPARQRGHQR